jgi:hypothetical protein
MAKAGLILIIVLTFFLIDSISLTTAEILTLPNSAPEGNIGLTYPIVDTDQSRCYNNATEISCPRPGEPFYGQDAQYIANAPSYSNNGDGTITDHVTGLIWQKAFEVMTYEEALEKVKTFILAKQADWRIPTIKELYSLILFSGVDVSSRDMLRVSEGSVPFMDNNFFDFKYGSNGPRIIDVQIPSSTLYKGTTMGGQETVFGVNFADGRIKGYPVSDPRTHSGKKYTVRFVRGNPNYGKNNFVDNGNNTISDLATGLMWQQSDSKKGMAWEDALDWVQKKNKVNYLGYGDWRLPNAKELHSIVDYSRSLQRTHSAAIDPLFEVTQIIDEGGKTNYPFFWSSTTHKYIHGGESAVYICFGEALGFFKPPFPSDHPKLQDVHGAGAQRSDPKTGNPIDYPRGHGPQGDVIRIYHYVRLVRDI